MGLVFSKAVHKLQKNLTNFFLEIYDSALEWLELSTLKKVDLKKGNSDRVNNNKNEVLGLVLTRAGHEQFKSSRTVRKFALFEQMLC